MQNPAKTKDEMLLLEITNVHITFVIKTLMYEQICCVLGSDFQNKNKAA